MIDLTKLTNVVKKGDKTIAQCPACAAVGADNKRAHLVVFANGAYSCVANPGDKEHSKEIYKLVGTKAAIDVPPRPMVEIRRQIIPPSTEVLKLGRFGRQKLIASENRLLHEPETVPAPSEAREAPAVKDEAAR